MIQNDPTSQQTYNSACLDAPFSMLVLVQLCGRPPAQRGLEVSIELLDIVAASIHNQLVEHM